MYNKSAAPQVTSERAKGRQLSDFPNLNSAEQKLRHCAKEGIVCDFGKSLPKTDENVSNNVSNEDRTIRAGVLRYLALGGCELSAVHERGIWIQGAIIEGSLDFTSCEDVRPIALEYCLMKGQLILRDARTRTINLDYSHICGSRVSGSEVDKRHMAIEAKRAKVDGSIYCRRGFFAEGEVNFIEADIKGSLECHGGRFKYYEGAIGNSEDGEQATDADKIAIACSRMKVGGSVFFISEPNCPFEAEGQVRFQRAEIGGDLRCDGGKFSYPGKDALHFARAKITGSAFLRNGVRVDGGTNFIDAEIGNSFECQAGYFNNPGGIALYCSRIKVNGSVFFKKQFQSLGEVSLRNAQIGGHLVGTTGIFNCPEVDFRKLN